MITRLYLDNCFRHHNQTFLFDKGLTGIVGPNESGKSLIVEMVRFALFGTKALRGKADDYKKLHVELDFIVNGKAFTVVRKGTKATLEGEDQQVSGTTPVNDAILRILGYDLKVFDVANACNQGNIEALSAMKPTERKAMVDRTVRLDQLDSLISFAGQEGNALKREADAMSKALVQPVAPEERIFDRSVEELEALVTEKTAEATEFNQLTGFLGRAPAQPTAPGDCEVPGTAEELREKIEKRKVTQRSLANLNTQRKNLEPEAYTPADLNDIETQLDQADAWKQKERLLAKGHHECPACSHQWPIADLGELADVEEVQAPAITRQQLAAHRTRIGNDDKIAGLDQAISELEEVLAEQPDMSADLEVVEAHQARVRAYERNLKAYNEYNEGLAEKQARHEELQGVAEELAALQEELTDARQFARDQARFVREQEAYEAKQVEVTETADRAQDLLDARDAIKALKVAVKSHLLPSLNKVASVLLSQMTGGERYQVEVDDDFEITIDGQAVGTLSGSGKAVANLAIRIALGQILTNRVFSFFAADEVDAAMDDERAAYTADALRRLTDNVGQVILVTHKRPETDQMVELKKS